MFCTPIIPWLKHTDALGMKLKVAIKKVSSREEKVQMSFFKAVQAQVA